MTEPKEVLKPCPGCGVKPTLCQVSEKSGGYFYMCENYDCHTYLKLNVYDDKSSARLEWNQEAVVKLKPCPFCGEEPTEMHDVHDYPTSGTEIYLGYGIACHNYECGVMPEVFNKKLDQAINLWNRRVES